MSWRGCRYHVPRRPYPSPRSLELQQPGREAAGAAGRRFQPGGLAMRDSMVRAGGAFSQGLHQAGEWQVGGGDQRSRGCGFLEDVVAGGDGFVLVRVEGHGY